MFSNVELPRTRERFWRLAPRRDGGRTEIWEALREAAESEDLERKQRILDVNNIRLGNRDMTVCYDDTGTFILHVCIYLYDEHVGIHVVSLINFNMHLQVIDTSYPYTF
ncbi:putative Ubiquitin domain-containing protein [Helianthus anomalus]